MTIYDAVILFEFICTFNLLTIPNLIHYISLRIQINEMLNTEDEYDGVFLHNVIHYYTKYLATPYITLFNLYSLQENNRLVIFVLFLSQWYIVMYFTLKYIKHNIQQQQLQLQLQLT